MNQVYEKVTRCYESIKDKIPFMPRVALVLGSGLGNYADTMEVKGEIDYKEIEDFRCLPYRDMPVNLFSAM